MMFFTLFLILDNLLEYLSTSVYVFSVLKVNISAAKVVINMTEVILLICELYQMPTSVYELMVQSISDVPFVTKSLPAVLLSPFLNKL